MSIVIDRADNVIVNLGGQAHRTGWVRVNVKRQNQHIGYAIARGQGIWGANVRGIKTDWSGTPIQLDQPLTLEYFVQLTGWTAPSLGAAAKAPQA